MYRCLIDQIWKTEKTFGYLGTYYTNYSEDDENNTRCKVKLDG